MMFHAAMILIAGVIWTVTSGVYTESIEERMANLEDALSHVSGAVKEHDNTLRDLLTAVS
mgnify:CR=1 FL=1